MGLPYSTELVRQLDATLPQTQCTQCGYPRCRDYAEAMARGSADINQCPPGGDTTIGALARLLQTALKPLNPANGAHTPRTRAVIDESLCIGCRKCLDVCPVDAIVGARKLMHTVMAQECNGCGLCLPPCPVDCIAMVPAPASGDSWPEYTQAEADHWRRRTEQRLLRLARRRAAIHAAKAQRRRSIFPDSEAVRTDLHAAIARARQKKASR
jgi:Na+-translocating ferredoxin:NAD+ oxidoreductase subunit B